MSSAGGGTDRAGLLARIRAALRSQVGDNEDDEGEPLHFGETPGSAYQSLADRLGHLAANNQPIADLFDNAGDEASARAGIALINGLSQGPLAIAGQLAQALSIPQHRAETIARNELVSSYRDAQMANYRANSDVVGSWLWSAAVASACIMCVDMDGTIHSMEEDLIDHTCGRCEPLPITRSWSDIMGSYGLSAADIPETRITESYGTGKDWFYSQSEATQISIMGPAKFEAWQRGDISLDDLVGVRQDGEWGGALYEKSLKELGLDARDYLPKAPERGLGPRGREAVQEGRRVVKQSEIADLEASMERIELPGGGYTYVLRDDASQFDLGSGGRNVEADIEHWQNIDDVMAGLRAQKPGEGELELREPKEATTPTATYTHADLTSKSMADLRQIARDMGVTPARTKAETIDRILAKSGVNKAPAAERVAALRRQIDERMAEREALYDQQNALVEEKDKLELALSGSPYAYPNPKQMLESAEYRAKLDLYHQSLDQADPQVKQYLKDLAAREKAKADVEAAKIEQDRAEKEMLRLSFDKSSVGYQQAKADYDAAVLAQKKAEKAEDKAYRSLWTKSPDVYKPELQSIANFNDKIANPVTHYDKYFHPVRTPRWTDKEIANHPFVIAAKKEIAGFDTRLAEVKAELKDLEKPIKDINKAIDKQLAQMKELQATLREGGEIVDTMRPFSDVIELPEGHQPPNAVMNKLDYKMKEPRAVTKSRIIDNIANRLKDNPEWSDYVSRMPRPHLGQVYHAYIGDYATAKDTKSAQLVADLVKKWGVGYAPGSPEWIAQQMAVKDEFGLDAAIHAIRPEQLRRGEAFYAENGPALRAFMRAMYDNTQQWFSDNGITEIDLYRGFHWDEGSDALPKGITWGELDNQARGVADVELNPYQSFSADINISQGTTIGGGFGGGFAGRGDYRFLIGARVPVDRILSTAQSGFGAKLESEIVVMGRATDTVAYRAGTRVEADLLRAADEQAVGDREMVYSLADGTTVRVAANADGTFVLTYGDGPQPKLGTLKLGSSKSYKTEKGINNALKAMRFSNSYVAPDLSTLALQEGEAAASGARAAEDVLAARIDNIPADVTTVPDIQDWLKAQFPNAQVVDLMGLDAQTARLVANASANLIGALPEVVNNLWRIADTLNYSDAIAMVPRDGLSILLNPDKWTDLAGLAERSAQYAKQGWWVGETPEEIIGHEIGHAVQINYGIDYNTWLDAMERVAADGGNPLVSEYAGNKIEESFAETFALLVYGQPTDAQMAIVREMAHILSDNGIDYNALRAAVGAAPLSLT